MASAKKMVSELRDIGTFIKRIEASAVVAPASAGISLIGNQHGFQRGPEDQNFSILANADGRSIVYGKDGSWLYRDKERTFVGLGSDQLEYQLRTGK